jgi:hypothetical protein
MELRSIYSRKISLFVQARSNNRKHALVGQLQSRVNRVLAYDQTVLVCHDHSSETDNRLVTLFQSVCICVDIFFCQRVSFVKT